MKVLARLVAAVPFFLIGVLLGAAASQCKRAAKNIAGPEWTNHD